MKTFESFCDEISTSVENKIISRYGKGITGLQASALLRHGYILGGFTIPPSLIVGLVLFIVVSPHRFSFFECGNICLKRDIATLSRYYSKYELQYHECNDESDKTALSAIIEQDLLNYTMDIIDNTHEFGG